MLTPNEANDLFNELKNELDSLSTNCKNLSTREQENQTLKEELLLSKDKNSELQKIIDQLRENQHSWQERLNRLLIKMKDN